MSITDIKDIRVGAGEAFRPTWPEGAASPTWSEVEWRCFADSTGQLFGGGWEGEPGRLECDPYPYDEVCIMLSGRVALIDCDGGRREFGAGEAFFIPRGFRGAWETIETSSKIFVGMAEPTYAAP